MNGNRFKITILTTASLAVLMLSSCSETQSQAKESKEEVVSIPVVASPVVIGKIDAAYGTTASLEAAEEASVTARVTGIVQKVFVEEGDSVEAGQALAQLDVDKLRLELMRANATLSQLANELQRNKKIYEKQLISSEAYDRTNYQYQAQKAATELAALNLEYATIRAPIAGVIANRHIKVGNLLKQNEAAFQIANFSEIYAIIHIPESEKATLEVGQLANVYVDAVNQPFVGNIDRVSPIIDKNTGTFKVTVSLKDKTRTLRPGMFSRVSVIYDTHAEALLVPKDSIISQDEEKSVFIVKDGIAYKRTVSLGFIDSDYVEITEGIESHEMIITTGQRNLKDESNVELIESLAQI